MVKVDGVQVAIVWMRNILRIHDNPLLTWASCRDDLDAVVPIIIMDPERGSGSTKLMGSARMRFLHDSIIDLSDCLSRDHGAGLTILSGRARELIPMTVKSLNGMVKWVICDYVQDPESREDIDRIHRSLSDLGVKTKVFPAVNTILDIEAVTKDDEYENPKSSKDMDKILTRNLGVTPEGYLVPKPVKPIEKIKYCEDLVNDLNDSNFLRGRIVTRNYLASFPRQIVILTACNSPPDSFFACKSTN